MTDPQKRMEDVAWECGPSLELCISVLRAMQDRTWRYDSMFPWLRTEGQEIWASLDYYVLEHVISILQDQVSEDHPEQGGQEGTC